MNENAAAEWANVRGEKWLTQIARMEAMLAPVNEPLIRALHLDASYRIADIGCGGGATTIEISNRMPAGSIVHGFDISPVLITLARTRKPAISFEIADMAAASPPEELYHRLVSRFAVMFFEDPPAAFGNLLRWLAPNGRFAFAVWGRPAENPWMTSVRRVVAENVEMPPIDPEGPGLFRYAEPEKLVDLLSHAGFRELNVEEWRGALPIGGRLPAAEAANFALASFSSFAELLAQAGEEALVAARQSLTANFSRHLQEDAVWLDASVHIVSGTRPR